MAKKTQDTPIDGVRLEDVAREAGVGISTVSRALHNPDRVNAKTREHVQAIARTMGYSGNLAARQLRTGLSRVVLVIAPPFRSNEVLASVFNAIDAELMRSGYSMVVGTLADDRQADPRLIAMARGGFVDGIIAVTNEPPGAGRELSIMPAQLPSVGLLIDLSPYGIPSLVTAESEAMEVMCGELIRRGHRHIGFGKGLGGYHDDARYAGFAKAVAAAPQAVRTTVFAGGDYTFRTGIDTAQQFLAMPDRPTAMMLTNDHLALAFMKTVRDAGLAVPGDVAVTGFDDLGASAFFDPSLTTYRQPMEELGAEATRLLLAMIGGERPERITRREIRGKLCIRGSI